METIMARIRINIPQIKIRVFFIFHTSFNIFFGFPQKFDFFKKISIENINHFGLKTN